MQRIQTRGKIDKSAMIAVLGLAILPWADAHGACNATVNGIPMTHEQCNFAAQIYGSVEPGHYWMNGNGTWGKVGDPNPRGNIYSGAYQSGGGSGERYGNGSWVHNQDKALGGGYVGGDGNGCYYTESWSNC